MARRKTRVTSTFSLSFLDIMSCGLGAAVLIFLLLKHAVDSPELTVDPQTLSEINVLEEEILVGEKNLVRIRNTISDVTRDAVLAQGQVREISKDIAQLKRVLEELESESLSDTTGLKQKIARLEKQKDGLEITALRSRSSFSSRVLPSLSKRHPLRAAAAGITKVTFEMRVVALKSIRPA